ncbi:MAG: GIY-YIG nuclease family protein [Candidatus Neomarinimicrobiota bacterium]
MYYVYVIESLSDGFRYTGMSEKPENRLKSHNAGKVKSTKHHTPFKLIYQQYVGSRSSAREREKYLKSSAGRRFIDRITASGGSLPD